MLVEMVILLENIGRICPVLGNEALVVFLPKFSDYRVVIELVSGEDFSIAGRIRVEGHLRNLRCDHQGEGAWHETAFCELSAHPYFEEFTSLHIVGWRKQLTVAELDLVAVFTVGEPKRNITHFLTTTVGDMVTVVGERTDVDVLFFFGNDCESLGVLHANFEIVGCPGGNILIRPILVYVRELKGIMVGQVVHEPNTVFRDLFAQLLWEFLAEFFSPFGSGVAPGACILISTLWAPDLDELYSSGQLVSAKDGETLATSQTDRICRLSSLASCTGTSYDPVILHPTVQ